MFVFLWPTHSQLFHGRIHSELIEAEDSDSDESDDDENEELDTGARLAQRHYPSFLGMNFDCSLFSGMNHVCYLL